MAKVSCILRHWGVQLILAYSWARLAILVAGKGRGGMLLFRLFLHFHLFSSFFPVPLCHLLYYLFCLFSPFLWETTQIDPQRLTWLNPKHNQSKVGVHQDSVLNQLLFVIVLEALSCEFHSEVPWRTSIPMTLLS